MLDVMASSRIVCVLWLLVTISCSTAVECDEESNRDTARDVPLIEIQTIEKTDQRIEVEIASSILIQTTWYGDIFIEDDNDTRSDRYGRVLLPLAEETEATVWMHRRLEGDLIITTAGVAKINPSGNENYHRNVEFRITANKAIWYIHRFEWGAEDVDTSLLPILEAISPSFFQPDRDEDVKAFAVVKGDVRDIFWSVLTARQSNVSTYPDTIYDSTYKEEPDMKKGVHATSLEEPNEMDGINTTTASIAITDTSSESNLGYYTCLFTTNHYSTFVRFDVAVLPQWLMRQVSEEPIVPRIWHSRGLLPDGENIGMIKDQPGQIACSGFGYPLDDITVLRDNLQNAPVETILTLGYGTAVMYLKSVQEEDVGTYTCVVSSHDRVFKREVSVMLMEHIDVDFVVVSQTEDEVTMSCSVRGYPVPSLVLARMDNLSYTHVDLEDGGINDIDVTRDENGHIVTAVLVVSVATEDYGSYRCTAVNEFDEVAEWLDVNPL